MHSSLEMLYINDTGKGLLGMFIVEVSQETALSLYDRFKWEDGLERAICQWSLGKIQLSAFTVQVSRK